jgi:hypothetical protein
MRLKLTLVAVLVLFVLALPANAASPGPRTVALAHVSKRLHLTGVSGVVTLRSRVDRRWTLVDGYYRKPGKGGLWALWLKQRSGRWVVVYGGTNDRADAPAGKVPCDIWPAFSEPSCTAG